MLSGRMPNGPLLRLVYNSKWDALGLKNIGRWDWRVSDPEGERVVAINEVAVIRPGMEILPEPSQMVKLAFLGYEDPMEE